MTKWSEMPSHRLRVKFSSEPKEHAFVLFDEMIMAVPHYRSSRDQSEESTVWKRLGVGEFIGEDGQKRM